MEKITQIDDIRYRSDRGYIFSLYDRAAAFKRESDRRILVLESYTLPDSVFVVKWPGIVDWSDGTKIPEEEVQILMQIVLDINSLAKGWRIANVRGPIPGQ